MGTIPSLSECNPGVKAVGFRVIVAVEPIETKTAGGILLPDSARDKDKLVQVRGRVVSIGSVAFDFARFPEGTAPEPGNAIMFSKLAGYMFDGADGKEYRLIHDQDVSAIIIEDKVVEAPSFDLEPSRSEDSKIPRYWMGETWESANKEDAA